MDGPARILVVDDTDQNRRLMDAVLTPRGYTVLGAASGPEALESRVQAQVEELERLSRLRRFLSPQLADVIVSSDDESMLRSHRREITVVFCDLRGFTAFSETAEPEEVMGVLGEFHRELGQL